MNKNELSEINKLWEPVRPYLVKQVRERYGRTDGDILELGPFSGLIFAFAQQRIGDSFTIAAFPENALALLTAEAKSLNAADSVALVASDATLGNIPDDSADLVIFRGALFFPSVFLTDFTAIHRVLKPGGIAFVGGGYGIHTPSDLIKKLGDRSRELNLVLGKVSIEPDGLVKTLEDIGLASKSEIITDGGLWMLLRK